MMVVMAAPVGALHDEGQHLPRLGAFRLGRKDAGQLIDDLAKRLGRGRVGKGNHCWLAVIGEVSHRRIQWDLSEKWNRETVRQLSSTSASEWVGSFAALVADRPGHVLDNSCDTQAHFRDGMDGAFGNLLGSLLRSGHRNE